ncbi:MAG: ABC transporter substrate-binding protein [Spirochaetaceae bacterium]|jgi:branched-chain amino acid transport system substrate-binding protein|nr:ABC transporter substrate-binding protein [Spirochaetaceae bacterium]
MKTFSRILFAAAVCLALLAAGCAKKDVIKIGVFEPLTGANAGGGAIELEGIKLANKLYPEVTLGGKTYKIELVVADNKSDKVESANAVQRLITSDKVALVLGSWGSSLSIAGGEIAKDEHVPIIGLSCTNPLVTLRNDWYFRVCFIDPFQGTVMANYAYNDIGARNAVIVREISNDYSVGLAQYFTDRFIDLTGNPDSILGIVDYNTGDQDFSAQLTQVKAMNPDVVFAPGNFTESALVIKQARDLGIATPFIGGDTWETNEFLDVGGDRVEGVMFSSFYDSSYSSGDEDSIARTFLTAYVKDYNKDPAAVTALGFDGYLLALDAITRAGSADPAAIRDAIAATSNFEGVTGAIIFDENGDATKPAFIKEVKDGKFVFQTLVTP